MFSQRISTYKALLHVKMLQNSAPSASGLLVEQGDVFLSLGSSYRLLSVLVNVDIFISLWKRKCLCFMWFLCGTTRLMSSVYMKNTSLDNAVAKWRIVDFWSPFGNHLVKSIISEDSHKAF